ncbi:MAG: hypothetical protein K6U89_02080 [Chloroflexi bacterium]|nr:hypothetical protein [Chloroflexota bacterium]
MAASRLPSARWLRRPEHAAAIGCLLALAGLASFSLCLLPPDGTWSGDTGIRVLQVETLLRQGDFAVPYLGQAADPTNRWNPLAPRYFAWQGERYYPKFSPAYALLVAGVVALGGLRAAALPALLALALAAAALGGMLRLAGSRAGWVAALAVILASPLVFYANELWEHELAVALALVGMLLLVATAWSSSWWLPLGAGGAFGVGLWFRAELYAALPAILVAALVARLPRRSLVLALIATLLAALPLFGWQQALYGRAEGAQVALDSPLVLRGAAPVVIAQRLLRQWGDTIPSLVVPQGPLLLWLLAAGLIVGGAFTRRRHRWGHGLLMAGLVLAAVLAIVNLALRLAPVDVVASCPLVLGGLTVSWRALEERRQLLFRVLALSALSYVVLALFTAPSPGGAQHGPRYLLLSYPLLIGCAVLAGERWLACSPSWRRTATLATLGVLAAASLAVQLAGLRNLLVIREQYAMVARVSAALPPGPLVTDLWWYPQVVPAEVLRRPVFLVRDGNDLAMLADRLAEQGAAQVTLVTSAEQPRWPLPDRTMGGRALRAAPPKAIAPRQLQFQSVTID